MQPENRGFGQINSRRQLTMGVISDTHGHVDKRLIRKLKTTDLIIHAGDIDGPEALEKLQTITTVIPVRGNMDYGAWTQDLPEEEFLEIGSHLIYVIHDLTQITIDPRAANVRVVINGHTHRPSLHKKNGVIYLNPGSASLPRGGFRASMAIIDINGEAITCRHVDV